MSEKMNTMYKQVMCDVTSVSVTKDAKSPYWVAQWTDARSELDMRIWLFFYARQMR